MFTFRACWGFGTVAFVALCSAMKTFYKETCLLIRMSTLMHSTLVIAQKLYVLFLCVKTNKYNSASTQFFLDIFQVCVNVSYSLHILNSMFGSAKPIGMRYQISDEIQDHFEMKPWMVRATPVTPNDRTG